MVCLALNVWLVGKSLNPYLPVVEYPDASTGLFSLTSCVGPTSFCLPHSLLSSVCFFYFASRLELYASCMGILPSLMLTLSCVGPGSKASRRKLLRIAYAITTPPCTYRWGLQRLLYNHVGSASCTPESKWRTPHPLPLYLHPLKRLLSDNLRRDAQRPMQIPTSVDRCAQKESLSITKTRMLSKVMLSKVK